MTFWLLAAALPALLALGAAQTLPTGEPAALVGTYRLTFRPDSTNPATRTELLYLALGKTQSQFESQGKRAGDSLLVQAENVPFSQENAQHFADQLGKLPHSRFNYAIYKAGTPRHLSYYDRLGSQHYHYEEPNALAWTIAPETTTVAGYTCQRATTTFGGRQWEAWFTREVPVSDGPYKFYGLPGLIVKVGDTRQQYVFELLRLAKPTAEYLIALPSRASTSTDKVTFRNAQADYDRNRAEQLLANGNIRFNTPEEAEQFRQKARERAKRPTNPLELK